MVLCVYVRVQILGTKPAKTDINGPLKLYHRADSLKPSIL